MMKKKSKAVPKRPVGPKILKLQQYLRKLRPQARYELADDCDVSLLHLRFISYGHKLASVETAMRIEVATNQAILAEEILPSTLYESFVEGRIEHRKRLLAAKRRVERVLLRNTMQSGTA